MVGIDRGVEMAVGQIADTRFIDHCRDESGIASRVKTS